MTADSQAMLVPHTEDDAGGHMSQGVNTALLGMLLFIGSELMFFAGLFGAYFNTRATALGLGQPWPPSGLEDVIEPGIVPIAATVILVLSSFTMQWGVWRIRKGDRTGMNRALALTLVMGLIFLGMQAYDYLTLVTEHGFGINSGIYGSLFFTMTGFHGAHVFGGVVGISVILLRGLAGQFSANHHIAVEAVSAYWHFVDIVWIALFATLYFLK
ncbi:MAG TPA: cytochrome c oxidase subunit 3 [Candidatus Limnocylindrales bacterium]|jgi:cytochrome c oxidase subunit 3